MMVFSKWVIYTKIIIIWILVKIYTVVWITKILGAHYHLVIYFHAEIYTKIIEGSHNIIGSPFKFNIILNLFLRYCVNVYHMNSDDRQDKIDRKRGKLKYGFQVLPRRTASILMEINNNGECRNVTSLDDSNIAAPISSDKKVIDKFVIFSKRLVNHIYLSLAV